MCALNRYYWPTKYSSRQAAMQAGVKCVFISHQKGDKDSAKKVADYLINAGIDIYFDEYDGTLKLQHQNNNPKGVTNSICSGINNSSHMLVVVSKNTMQSNWVPFEIGYGYDKTDLRILCLKGIAKGALPEYIRAVPIIRDIWDLNYFIGYMNNETTEKLFESRKIEKEGTYNPLYEVMDGLIVDSY